MLLRHRLAIVASLATWLVATALAGGRVPLVAMILGPKW
jgi:hypothetical protein